MSNKREIMLEGLDSYLSRIFGNININPGKDSETGELYYTIAGIEISIDYNSRTRSFRISKLVDDESVESYTYDLDGEDEKLYHNLWKDFIQLSLQEFRRNSKTI